MHETTPLISSGLINGHDRLTVELVQPPDMPAAILLRWPQNSRLQLPHRTPTATWPRRACRYCRRPLSNWLLSGHSEGCNRTSAVREPRRKSSGALPFPLPSRRLAAVASPLAMAVSRRRDEHHLL